MRARVTGFTLMELVVTIVLLAAVLGPMVGFLVSQSRQAVDPLQQVRASQLAQHLFNQMLSRAYDQNSDLNGGRWRCGETVDGISYAECTASSDYGPDSGESLPLLFNDVDDFDTTAICQQGLTSCSPASWIAASFFTQGSAGEQQEYANFAINIRVTPRSGCAARCAVAKHIALQVRLPDGSVLPFAFERGNY